MRGWVYVITNEAMADIVKVGFSTKDPSLRAAELSTTGVPHPYRVVYDVLVEEPRDVEQRSHRELSQFRERKEWFRCHALVAVCAIRASTGPAGALLERWHGVDIPSDADAAAVAILYRQVDEAGGEAAAFPYLVRAAELGDLRSLATLAGEYDDEEGAFHNLIRNEAPPGSSGEPLTP